MTNAVWVKAWIGRVFFDFAISYVCVPGCLGVELWQKLFRHLCCVREWGSHCISIFIFLSSAVFCSGDVSNVSRLCLHTKRPYAIFSETYWPTSTRRAMQDTQNTYVVIIVLNGAFFFIVGHCCGRLLASHVNSARPWCHGNYIQWWGHNSVSLSCSHNR